MAVFSPMVAARIVFYLGLVNIVVLLLLFLTCRCTAGMKSLGLGKHAWYREFMKFHCYLWWILFASVVVHAFLAISFLGVHF